MPSRSEINFITMWRARVGSDGHVLWDAGRDNPLPGRLPVGLANCRPGHRTNTSVYVLTPEGTDLIATADAIGFEPETARADDDPMPVATTPTCLTCDGEREVKILGDFANPCPDCPAWKVTKAVELPWHTGREEIFAVLLAAHNGNDEVDVQWEMTGAHLSSLGGRVISYDPGSTNLPFSLTGACKGRSPSECWVTLTGMGHFFAVITAVRLRAPS